MADETDVSNTLVSLITAALYPNGTSLPSIASRGTLGPNIITLPSPVQCKIFRGFPTTQQQTDAIRGGYVNVSVFARNGVERNVSRYIITPVPLSPPVHTITAIVVGNTITIGGTVSIPQAVLVLVGQFWVTSYGVQANDTLTSIAAGLAALINAQYPGTTSTGPVITLPLNLAGRIIARIAGQGQTITETKRQERAFQITVWAPPCGFSNADADAWRTAVVNVVDPAVSSLIRFNLPDTSVAHIYYEMSMNLEAAQAEGLYRRDMMYWVEYPTTLIGVAPEKGVMQTQIQAGVTIDGTAQPVPAPAVVININS